MAKDLELGKRIARLRNDCGLSQEVAAEKIGIPPGTYQLYEYGNPPSRENFKLILKYYKCNGTWLFTGEGEPYPAEAQGTGPVLPDCPSEDYVFIRQMNGRISAGVGILPDNTADVQAAFRRDWITKKGSKPESMSLIKVDGDSMEPTLVSGDLVLVDHARNVVAAQGGIYAITLGHQIMIKRIQVLHDQGKYRIISDNKQYPPQETDAEKVAINGKILWFAREMER